MADLRNERGDTLSANDLLLLCPSTYGETGF
jgi:hypothetical protein